jgi:hypothetical protein
MTTVELLDFKFTLACIYSSPDGNFCDLLKKELESTICKVQSKRKQFYVVDGVLISCKAVQNFKNCKIHF